MYCAQTMKIDRGKWRKTAKGRDEARLYWVNGLFWIYMRHRAILIVLLNRKNTISGVCNKVRAAVVKYIELKHILRIFFCFNSILKHICTFLLKRGPIPYVLACCHLKRATILSAPPWAYSNFLSRNSKKLLLQVLFFVALIYI